MNKDCSRLFVGSVERAIGVLRTFKGRESQTLAEIAESAGITRSAAQRFTHTLEALGYLKRDAGRRWQLTPRTLEIGAFYLATDTAIERANPHLVELNNLCSESVNLSKPDGNEMVYLARFTSNRPSFIHMPIGTRIPMFCAASGRAYLSRLAPVEAEAIVMATAGQSFTARTLTDPIRILARVEEARERGFASAEEEFYVGDLNIAAPIVGPRGETLGCVNISGPTSRWTMSRLEEELAPHLLHTVRAISPGGPKT